MITKEQSQVVIDIERSDGQRFKVGSGTDWKLPSDAIKNWNNMDFAVTTSPNVIRDGSTLVSKRVNEIDRSFTAVYKGKDSANERARAISFFNPKFSYKAHITYMGRTRWCEGEQIGFTPSTFNVYQSPEIAWTMLCADPYMRSESGNDNEFGDSVPCFGLPFVSHRRETLPDGTKYPVGFIASKLIFDGKNSVFNAGDVATWYRVHIDADGELINPCIDKDGKFVRVMCSLKAGDSLVIDFESTPPKVLLNGNNVINLTSRDSSFTGMEMQTGNNVFHFSVDNAENRGLARVKVIYYSRFLGV